MDMDSMGHVFEPEDFSKSVILELSLRIEIDVSFSFASVFKSFNF
jgi:hypothetical protein